MKDFIKLMWGVLVMIAGIISSLMIPAMVIILLYIMFTGQDIKNIHVAIVVVCFSYVWNKQRQTISK